MQSLASGVETLRRARVADVETTAQVASNTATHFICIKQLGGTDGTGGGVSSPG